LRTRTGQRNKLITLCKPTKTFDAAGTAVSTYTDLTPQVYAKISTSRSDEAIQAMAVSGSAIHNVNIRYRTDVRGNWRIKFGNKIFSIIGPPIDIDMAHKELDIKCKEVV